MADWSQTPNHGVRSFSAAAYRARTPTTAADGKETTRSPEPTSPSNTASGRRPRKTALAIILSCVQGSGRNCYRNGAGRTLNADEQQLELEQQQRTAHSMPCYEVLRSERRWSLGPGPADCPGRFWVFRSFYILPPGCTAGVRFWVAFVARGFQTPCSAPEGVIIRRGCSGEDPQLQNFRDGEQKMGTSAWQRVPPEGLSNDIWMPSQAFTQQLTHLPCIIRFSRVNGFLPGLAIHPGFPVRVELCM